MKGCFCLQSSENQGPIVPKITMIFFYVPSSLLKTGYLQSQNASSTVSHSEVNSHQAKILVGSFVLPFFFKSSVSECSRVNKAIKPYLQNIINLCTYILKSLGLCLPPSVADNRKWVPYFLIRLSVIIWVVGLRPRSRMFLMNSGVRGKGDSRKSLLSTAKLFTFHLPNSLEEAI